MQPQNQQEEAKLKMLLLWVAQILNIYQIEQKLSEMFLLRLQQR
jgi:hypothetical protein